MDRLRVGLIYDRFGDTEKPDGAPSDWDAEYEPEETIVALEEALHRLGHEPVRIGNVRTLLPLIAKKALQLDAAVNIAESYGSRNREAHAPVLLELAGIPCIGSDALCLSLTLDKHLTKEIIRANGFATPDWKVIRFADDRLPEFPAPWFVKPRYEGTAKGISPSSRRDTETALRKEIVRQLEVYHQDVLVEAFVAGSEFTVAVIGGEEPADPPTALPILQRAVETKTGIGLHALERYEDPANPFDHIVHPVLDSRLEADLHAQSLGIFDLLECRDFARIDFRVDESGKPWFLEINPLPTFAPDGTFAIIAELAGMDYPAFLAEVLERGLQRVLSNCRGNS